MRTLSLLIALAACGDDGSVAADGYVPTETGGLGLNDVSILMPLPAAKASPTLLGLTTDLVPADLFQRLVVTPGDVVDKLEDFQLVAVRFDLCDRQAPGACPSGLDGRLRLVFQPILASTPTSANDVALHAFYPIPAAELGPVVDELRGLARLGATPVDSPLAVSGALGVTGYRDQLRALVTRYASAARLLRLTLFAQNAFTASLNWAFRGVEARGATFEDIAISGIDQPQQRAILVGSDGSYDTMPVADSPAGFVIAIDSLKFSGATSVDRMQALEGLAALQNPTLNTAETVQCIGCHVATLVTARRAAVAGVDPTTLASRFSASFDLSTAAGISTMNERSLRAFGWLFEQPAISQRVVNDTAQTLVEIAQRFPPAT